MKNYAPKSLKEVVQELEIIDENMAFFVGDRFCQNDYENGYEKYMVGTKSFCSYGPLDFFIWSNGKPFSFPKFEKRNRQLNKIFKKKAKAAKKLSQLNQSIMEIDYAGCDPEVAKFLKKHGGKRGILCSDGHGSEDFVVAYCKDYPYPYRTKNDEYATAIPIKQCEKIDESYTVFGKFHILNIKEEKTIAKVKTITKVKNAVALMQALVDEGYEMNGYGHWIPTAPKLAFVSQMWQYAGTEDLGGFSWELEWLE